MSVDERKLTGIVGVYRSSQVIVVVLTDQQDKSHAELATAFEIFLVPLVV